MVIREFYADFNATFKPRDLAVAERYRNQFPSLNLFTIAEVFGGWVKAQAAHFKDGGTFDKSISRAARPAGSGQQLAALRGDELHGFVHVGQRHFVTVG